jgi:pimeloyl-ACP methyl ester carboxylesterase
VWGADEKDVPVSVAQEAMGLVKSPTSLTVLPGVDHHTPLFAPAALVDAVMAYLS